VHNTFGDRIIYTLRPEASGTVHTAGMPKEMYVSPFISMDSSYVLRVRDEPDRLQIVIDQSENGEPLLQASVALTRLPLTDTNLLRMLVRYPLVTVKTIVMIHWHAFRLWRKGAKFHPHGEAEQPLANTAQ
jgi:DUF1365 family protein